jgi:sugar/nucleoside kinase (ribokinase family)
MRLLTIGTVAFDNIETPFGKADNIVGGAATFIAYAAAKFGTPVNLCSIIGEDFPAEELADLQAVGANIEGLNIVKGGKSFSWTGRYHNDMNTRDTLATDLNVLADFDPKLPESYRNSEYVCLGNLTPQVQASVLDQLTNPKFVAMDTMNFWIEIANEDLRKVIARVDMLMINEEEARQLTGEYSLRRAARQILESGPKYLIIKKGEHGALLFSNENQLFFCPALPLEEVFDPTGAGDSFAGGFMGYLARTNDTSWENMKRAVVYGSCIASFSVEKFGTQRLKEVTRHEIDDRMLEFFDLIHFDKNHHIH